jgi:hypothetical protein
MTEPPNDAPRTGEPTAPVSESPASVSSNRRRKPQPHHRPSSKIMYEASSEPRVTIVVRRVADPAKLDRLLAIMDAMLDSATGLSKDQQ